MSKAIELLRQGKKEELWQLCCGFIDLSLEQFMTIQRRLLLEQLELLKRCELGREVMRGAEPSSVEEFRGQIPLTTYADYAPYLLEKREDVLPEKPAVWQRTSGRSAEFPCKWAPISERMYQELGEALFAIFIFCTCKERGDISVEEHCKVLYGLAPPPYISGTLGQKAAQELCVDFLPPMEEAELMSFEERIRRGFQLALSEGLDIFYGIPSVLVAVAEQFGKGTGVKTLIPLLSKPKILLRLTKAMLKSKLARRPLMPKDLWALQGVVSAGTDNAIYKDKIEHLWGKYPLDVYAATEANFIAMQTWDYQGMTFIPHFNFLEFIPEREHLRLKKEPTYQASTVLLDEVKAGEKYEVVVTNFHGGPFVRYRLGDMIRITSLRNEELGIDIPQMTFDRRADDLIEIAGFAGLTEKTIWQALENSGVAYQDWTARREAQEETMVHLYLELKENGEGRDEEQLAAAIHEQLRKLDGDYADVETILQLKPLKVTLLRNGAFQEYISRQRAAGAELAHLKPPHINPSDGIISTLLNSVSPK